MAFLHDLLLFLHFIGLSSLFGGLFVQVRTRPRLVNAAVLHGILTQLVTGALLVGLLEAQDKDVDHAKIGVKLAVALVIAVLVFVYRRRTSIGGGVYGALIGLTTANIAVAVFWH